MAELILRYAHLYHTNYDSNTSLNELLKWAFDVLKQSSLLVEKDLVLLHLAEQEVSLIAKEPNYKNPYLLMPEVSLYCELSN